MADNKKKSPFYLIDTGHAFYRPIATRLAIVAFALAWVALEVFASRDPFWMVIAIATAAYCIYVLLISYQPPEPAPDAEAPANSDAGDDDQA